MTNGACGILLEHVSVLIVNNHVNVMQFYTTHNRLLHSHLAVIQLKLHLSSQYFNHTCTHVLCPVSLGKNN